MASPLESAKRLGALSLIVFITLWLTGCQTVSYYHQVIRGHLGILASKQPIPELLEDDSLSHETKQRLTLVLEARKFAEQKLHLPVGEHYLDYVDLERRYVVWSVVAAPELSISAKKWCYPFVGCLSYRGYYSEQEAKAYAEQLKQQDYDVSVGGVAAYSTLGWFDDPVLNTFMYRRNEDIAALLFHELSHQLLYFEDDTAFNESFATAVELEGLKRWLAARGETELYQRKLRYLERRQQFIALLLQTKHELQQVYESEQPADVKRKLKQELFAQLEQHYQQLKQQWQTPPYFDSWFSRPINNARLVSVATYNDLVPQFQRALASFDHELPRFYQWCQSLQSMSKSERREALARRASAQIAKAN